MKDKKPVIITIVVLLLIFTPLTVISAFIKVGKNPLDENPGHDFYYKNKLWFYNNNELISSYNCKTIKCDLATTSITDTHYDINYYKKGNLEKVINNNKFTFIKDGTLTYLYNVNSGTVLKKYLQVKNYNTKIEDDIYIIQNENKLWGVLSVGEVLSSVIPFEYDFIGILNNDVVNEYLKVNNFIVSKEDKWYLIDKNNSIISSYFNEPIIDYNNYYIITKDNNKLKVYNYQGNEYLNSFNISDYAFYNNYIALVINNNIYIYNDLNNNYIKNVTITNNGKLKLEEINNQIVIKIDDSIIDYLNIY